MEGNDFSVIILQTFFLLQIGFHSEKEWNVSLGNYGCKSIVSHVFICQNFYSVPS